MTDIVERLRNSITEGSALSATDIINAATEIERLRAKDKRLRMLLALAVVLSRQNIFDRLRRTRSWRNKSTRSEERNHFSKNLTFTAPMPSTASERFFTQRGQDDDLDVAWIGDANSDRTPDLG